MAQPFTDHPETSSNGDSARSTVDISRNNALLVQQDRELAAYDPYQNAFPPHAWQEQAPPGISLIKVAHAFRRRWLLALFVGMMIGLPAAIAIWMIFPSTSDVEAMLRFQSTVGVFGSDSQINYVKEKGYRETQVKLITSPFMLQSAIREPEINSLPIIKREKEPITFLQKSIMAYIPKESDLLCVRMTGENPSEMVKVVNSLAKVYLEQAEDQAKQERLEKKKHLDQKIISNRVELDKKNKTYYAQLSTNGASDHEQIRRKTVIIERELSLLQERRRESERLLTVKSELLEHLRAKKKALDEGTYPEHLILQSIRRDPQMIELEDELGKAQKYLNFQRAVIKNPRDPSLQRADGQVLSLQEQIDKLKLDLRPLAIEMLKRPDEVRPEEDLPIVEARVAALTSEIGKIDGQIEQLKEQHLNLGRNSAGLEQLHKEIQQLEEINDRLIVEQQTRDLDLNLPAPVAKWADAEEPEGTSLTYRLILTMFAGLVGLAFGLSGVTLWEYTKQRVSSLSEVGHGGLGIRVLGTVPNLARLNRLKNGQAAEAVSGILAESIDSVRTMLLKGKKDSPRVVLVTSASEHEGKTTVATHLAASLARAGRRTLLVDGDLRKPSIHKLFDMPLESGLCEALRGEVEIESVIHPAHLEGMYVMLAGHCDHNSIAALAKEGVDSVFRTLRADYDFIVIDTAPVLGFADTMLLGSHSDAALLAILRDVSQIPKVYEAKERLEAIGVPVLGGVVGGVAQTGGRAYAIPAAGAT